MIYPIFCYAYLSAGSLFSAEGEPRAAIFEDAQHIVPAQEMMRGEHAYRDIIPPHGFVQDALLDYLLMRRGDDTLGRLLKSRGTISALNSMATYAVGVAATGSPEAGLVSFFLAVTTGGGGGTFRFLPALITLAIALQASRLRPTMRTRKKATIPRSTIQTTECSTSIMIEMIAQCPSALPTTIDSR